MRPEDSSRQVIDSKLTQAGWILQDRANINLSAAPGVVVRYYKADGSKEADYVLFIDEIPVGVIEAKKIGVTLTGVHAQSSKYLQLIGQDYSNHDLVFAYEATGNHIQFSDIREPRYRPREIFWFHTPSELRELGRSPPLRSKLQTLPALEGKKLRVCQHDAIINLENSLKESRPRALIQMASGAGKTYTAVNIAYRLIKYAQAQRILFLVDRTNLGKQSKTAFDKWLPGDDHFQFSALYPVQFLTNNHIDKTSRVVISTVQRLYSILKNTSFDKDDERSLFEYDKDDDPVSPVTYNSQIPIGTFDIIIIDECHRSIYNKWRQVLDYFDAFLIGLTATPSSGTIGFFRQNLVTEYSHQRAVADNVNVDYRIFRINTKVTSTGGTIPAHAIVEKRDRLTRNRNYEKLDLDLNFLPKELDRRVVVDDQIRTVIKTFKNSLPTMFPKRTIVPKTLVFAKDDFHADDITKTIREEFGEGEQFCQKITYRTSNPDAAIRTFRTSIYPRIVVSVDMIATGTDVKPLECLVFMRDVQSKIYYEQMKGRGARTISKSTLRSVTPDAAWKDNFVIVDAIGVTEHDHSYTHALDPKPSVTIDKLLDKAATNQAQIDDLESLASRLSRLHKRLDDSQIKEFDKQFDSLPSIINSILDHIDPDTIIELARKKFNTAVPTTFNLAQIRKEAIHNTCRIFHDPDLRNKLIALHRHTEQVLDDITKDHSIHAAYSDENHAKNTIQTFQRFVNDNSKIIESLIYYSTPFHRKSHAFDSLQDLEEQLKKSPYELSISGVWGAYYRLGKTQVDSPNGTLTDIISLIRKVVNPADVLEPFSQTIDQKFDAWLDKFPDRFSSEQLEWLTAIKDYIASSFHMTMDALDEGLLYQYGGRIKFLELFPPDILDELTQMLLSK